MKPFAFVRRLLRSFTGHMVLGVLVLHVVMLPLLLAGVLNTIRRGQENQFINQIRSDAYLFSTLAQQLVLSGRAGQLAGLMDQALVHGNVTDVHVLKANGTALRPKDALPPAPFIADTEFGGHGDVVFSMEFPLLTVEGTAFGKLRLSYDERPVLANIQGAYRLGAGQIGVYLLASLLLVYLLGRWLAEPLEKLRDAARAVTSGREAEPLDVSSRIGEVHSLAIDLDAMRRALVERSNAALGAARAKADFLATMSHEIRTPLNGVIGMTDLLMASPLSSQQQEFVQTIRTSGDLLMAVINDVLDFSKIEAGQLSLESRSFQLHECLQSAADLLANTAAGKGLDLECRIDPEVPAYLAGDETRLSQVVVNLLNNAIKFTATGKVTLAASAEALPAPLAGRTHRLRVEVRDTGIGMTAEQQARLFQPFAQGDASTTRRYGGTGLGLAICKRLVEAMGGGIGVMSKVGEGSTFYFNIPILAVASEQPVAMREQSALTGKRALIVDDNAVDLRILAKQATALGMECTTVSSGREALDLLVSDGRAFDVGMLDMYLSDMSGQMLARLLRGQPGMEHLPLILVTAAVKALNAYELMKEFSDILVKPVRAHTLQAAVTRALTAPRPVPEAAAETGAPEAAAPPAAQPLRLLLAEDNEINQRVILLTLRSLGYDATVAPDGRAALEAVRKQRYDIVLMDMQMPDMDGLEATRRIRAELPRDRQPHIIAMTANALPGDRERCLESGMNDYLSKPVHASDLAGALRRFAPPAGAEPGPDAAAPSAQQGPVDWSIVNRLLQLGALHELVAAFYQRAPVQLERMRQAIVAGTAADLRFAAHALKGSSASLGLAAVAARCGALEDLARDGSLDTASSKLVEIEAALDAAHVALDALPREDRRRRPRQPVAPPPAAPGGQRRVLVVDDSEELRAITSLYLRQGGFEVFTASGGGEGLDFAARHRPDLIVLDMLMPDLDGREVATRLRQRGYRGRILGLTAHSSPAELEAAVRAGCDACLTKPLRPDQLLAAVAGQLGAPPAGPH